MRLRWLSHTNRKVTMWEGFATLLVCSNAFTMTMDVILESSLPSPPKCSCLSFGAHLLWGVYSTFKSSDPMEGFCHIVGLPLNGLLRSWLLIHTAFLPELKKISSLLSYLPVTPSYLPHNRLLTGGGKEPQIAVNQNTSFCFRSYFWHLATMTER